MPRYKADVNKYDPIIFEFEGVDYKIRELSYNTLINMQELSKEAEKENNLSKVLQVLTTILDIDEDTAKRIDGRIANEFLRFVMLEMINPQLRDEKKNS